MPISKAWKVFERQLAAFFGGRRTPLSGQNSGHTSADVIHPTLFIEGKYRKVHTLFTLYRNTKALAKKEKKVPVVCLKEASSNGFLIVLHSDDLTDFLLTASSFPQENPETKNGIPKKPLRKLNPRS